MLQPRPPDVPETAAPTAGPARSAAVAVDDVRSASSTASTSPQDEPPRTTRGSLVAHVGPYPRRRRHRSKSSRKPSSSFASAASTGGGYSGTYADELSSSEQNTAEVCTNSERLQRLLFTLPPDLSGCLLQFSIDLQHKLRETGHEGNLLLSPFFVASSLVMLLRGASGNTYAQVASALHMEWDPSGTADRFEQMASDLFRDFERAKMRHLGLRLTCFMALFYDQSVPVRKEYHRLQDTLCYFMDRRDFRNESLQCRLTMDALARANSSFSVPREQVFPSGSVGPDTLLVLLSSLRLEGRWKRSFAVSRGLFPAEDADGTRVLTMRCTAPFRTVDCAELEATLVEVPYENPRNSMVILLPTGPGGLAVLEERLSAPLVLRCIDRLRDAGEVELSLPKFRIRHVTDLTQVLPLLGIREAFTGEARLDRLTSATGKGVHVSCVRHVATVHVSQTGARPAAERSRGSSLRPACAVAKRVAVDRPFMFLVLNRKPDLVLFLGSVTTADV
ncbi:ipis-1-like [Dermacentor variabilis]|uniref:ipis-1-like n=1 Tax=Dermacentor variabilis TaxID=34621 RepID=UPI003F5BFC38